MSKHLKFEGVKGYTTYANAEKRGNEIASKYDDISYRWVIIALPNGRFAPMVIPNENTMPVGFTYELNCCIAD